MKNLFMLAGAMALAMQSTTASAGVYADDLTRCLVSSTTSTDRTSFVRWVFAAMSANESVAALSTVTTEQREAFTKETTEIFERLILTDCREQSSNAIRYEGEATLAASFEIVGRVAFADLMRDPSVAAILSSMESYVDKEKWESFVLETTGRKKD